MNKINKIKICFITAARSEYGLLKWLMEDVSTSEKFKLQLIVTGGHLLEEQGHTIDQILEDGFCVDNAVDVHLDTTSQTTIAASMGRMAERFALAFEQLQPDYIVVLGDRYELLPICNTAFVMSIPIIHLSGGDITEGAIDNGIRNAVTMLSCYHFPGTEDSARNIIRMRGTDENVWAVGEPGLDAFYRENLFTRQELADALGIDQTSKWALMTYHAETKEKLEYNLEAVKNCLKAITELEGFQIVATYANADFGGRYINEMLIEEAKKEPSKIIVIPSLGHLRYLSFMKQVKFVIGNSSSGIVEAPTLKVPVVNVGNRQKGRYQCCNVFQCGINYHEIKETLNLAVKSTINDIDLNYWGDGHTSKRILRIMNEYL